MTTKNSKWMATHHFSIEDYHRMGEAGIFEGQRVELLHGKVVDRYPIKSEHSGVVNLLNRLLSHRLPDDFLVAVQNPVSIGQDSEPEPDLSVLKFREDFYRTSHPTPEDTLFIIEVADSSLEKDRKVKLPLYASAGIPEVWIVNLPAGQLERYRRPAQGEYTDTQVSLPGDRIETALMGTLEVALIVGKSGGNG